jgi:hypothetical protein
MRDIGGASGVYVQVLPLDLSMPKMEEKASVVLDRDQ